MRRMCLSDPFGLFLSMLDFVFLCLLESDYDCVCLSVCLFVCVCLNHITWFLCHHLFLNHFFSLLLRSKPAIAAAFVPRRFSAAASSCRFSSGSRHPASDARLRQRQRRSCSSGNHHPIADRQKGAAAWWVIALIEKINTCQKWGSNPRGHSSIGT